MASFCFPPANSFAVVSVSRFAEYLPEFGWESIVLTVNSSKYRPQTLAIELDRDCIGSSRGAVRVMI